jgi:hypothetical protein
MPLFIIACVLALAGCGGGESGRADAAAQQISDGSVAGIVDDGTDGLAGDGAAPPLPDCPCFAGDGIYCATAIASYGAAHACSVPGLAQHAGDLYRCAANAWSVATGCGSAGCYVAPSGQADGCHVAGTTRKLYVVFHPNAIARDLPGLFQCLLGRTDFNDRARGYANGYGLAWGGATMSGCPASDYTCGVSALAHAGFIVADHDVVELVEPGYCGGDNNARNDGVVVGNVRVRGANIGDCSPAPAEEEPVAVHEAFECAGHWADADCCTGEVDASRCADNGEAFCPDCPCSCGQFQSDGSYGGYTLDCGSGKTYWSQRVPKNPAGEYDPSACTPFNLTH